MKTKYKSSTEGGKCVFCEIVNGNIQTPGIFWEDNNYIAFLSRFPSTEGFNTKITVIKRRAYGFRDLEYFKLNILQSCA